MNTSLPTPAAQRVRLDYIDALRGIAAIMVMVCHCPQIDAAIRLPEHVSHFIEAFKYGVQLFFVISAFTIFYSLYSSDSSTYNFFIRRFFRIAPLYFTAVIGYGILYRADAKGMLLNILFLHGFSPRYINSVVPGGWSIGVEMAFYCLVPLLFRTVTNLRRALCFLLSVLVLAFCVFYAYRQLINPWPALESFMYFWLPNQLPAFGIGFLVYFLTFRASGYDIRSFFYPLLSIAVLVMIALLTGYSVFSAHVLFAAASGLTIYLLKFLPLPGLVNRATLFLGKISYSLYLSQYAAISFLQKTGFYSLVKGRSGFVLYLNTAINLFFLFIATVIISYLLYHAIELPCQKIGKKLLRKKVPFVEINQRSGFGRVQTIFRRNSIKG